MSGIIPAKDVARVFLDLAKEVAVKHYPEATPEEIDRIALEMVVGSLGGLANSPMAR